MKIVKSVSQLAPGNVILVTGRNDEFPPGNAEGWFSTVFSVNKIHRTMAELIWPPEAKWYTGDAPEILVDGPIHGALELKCDGETSRVSVLLLQSNRLMSFPRPNAEEVRKLIEEGRSLVIEEIKKPQTTSVVAPPPRTFQLSVQFNGIGPDDSVYLTDAGQPFEIDEANLPVYVEFLRKGEGFLGDLANMPEAIDGGWPIVKIFAHEILPRTEMWSLEEKTNER